MRNDFSSNYLMHHGILGQKWGVRRYQNPDGSLTSAGREHYGVKEGGSVSDISTAKGYNRRVKDLKKAIKKNEKKRGKEHTKIANNPENFLGANKKHAKKIEEYSENIRKGQSELDSLMKKAESEGFNTRFGKIREKKSDSKREQKNLASSIKKQQNLDSVKDQISKGVSAEQKKELREKYKKMNDAFDAEEKFWSSKEATKARDDAYNETLLWYKKNEPEQLNAWIKDSGGKDTGLNAYHDFRKVFEGTHDEKLTEAEQAYRKRTNVDTDWDTAYSDWSSYSDQITKQLVGKYGNQKISGSSVSVNSYVKNQVDALSSEEKKKKK